MSWREPVVMLGRQDSVSVRRVPLEPRAAAGLGWPARGTWTCPLLLLVALSACGAPEPTAEVPPAAEGFELLGLSVSENDHGESYCYIGGVRVDPSSVWIAEDQRIACPASVDGVDDLSGIDFDDLSPHVVAGRHSSFLRSVLGTGSASAGEARFTQAPVNQQRRLTLQLAVGGTRTTHEGTFLLSGSVPRDTQPLGRAARNLMETWEALHRPELYRAPPPAPDGRPSEPEYRMGMRVFPSDPCAECVWRTRGWPPAMDDPNPRSEPPPPTCVRPALPDDPSGVYIRAACHTLCCPQPRPATAPVGH